jgi:hypothetical protein
MGRLVANWQQIPGGLGRVNQPVRTAAADIAAFAAVLFERRVRRAIQALVADFLKRHSYFVKSPQTTGDDGFANREPRRSCGTPERPPDDPSPGDCQPDAMIQTLKASVAHFLEQSPPARLGLRPI